MSLNSTGYSAELTYKELRRVEELYIDMLRRRRSVKFLTAMQSALPTL